MAPTRRLADCTVTSNQHLLFSCVPQVRQSTMLHPCAAHLAGVVLFSWIYQLLYGCVPAEFKSAFGPPHSRGSKENDKGAPIFNCPKSACRGFTT